jgi:hypothetical protein
MTEQSECDNEQSDDCDCEFCKARRDREVESGWWLA